MFSKSSVVDLLYVRKVYKPFPCTYNKSAADKFGYTDGNRENLYE